VGRSKRVCRVSRIFLRSWTGSTMTNDLGLGTTSCPRRVAIPERQRRRHRGHRGLGRGSVQPDEVQSVSDPDVQTPGGVGQSAVPQGWLAPGMETEAIRIQTGNEVVNPCQLKWAYVSAVMSIRTMFGFGGSISDWSFLLHIISVFFVSRFLLRTYMKGVFFRFQLFSLHKLGILFYSTFSID
jgi:hypothetical protein